MNIQLFLDNKEVDLGQDVTIPMNKTYSNLFSPSEIIIDYSKEIQIPITQNNNRILGNAYRLDRRIVEGTNNIGYHLDPTKRIPAKLVYNGKTILDGYAKFVSASYSNTSKHYNLNLFGAIGDVIKKLMSVTTSKSLLPDGLGEEYVLDDNLSGKYLNSEYVYNSWVNEDNKTGSNVSDYDIIGFAPSHRGFYPDFASDKAIDFDVLTGEQSIRPISELLEAIWSYKGYDYTAKDIVGEGFKDYMMGEFRACMMKPYIYINQLFRMYQNQCRKLSDYKITLDGDWFNDANPYWSKMCYMLDFIDSKGSDDSNTVTLLSSSSKAIHSYTTTNYAEVHFHLIDTVPSSKVTSSTITTSPITLVLEGNHTSSIKGDLKLTDGVVIKITANVSTKASDGSLISKDFFYWTSIGTNVVPPGGSFTEKNYVPNSFVQFTEGSSYKTKYTITIPGLWMEGVQNSYVGTFIAAALEKSNSASIWSFTTSSNTTKIIPKMGDSNFTLEADIIQQNNWRTSTKVKLSDLYMKEDPLFKTLIDYTKMFGLIWDIDYDTKTINILDKRKYFKNYKIENWSDMIDRSRDLIIEPNTIGTKFIKFNYDDVDGYRYNGYKNKYGLNYGEKFLSSKYEFNNDTLDLFSGIYPSSTSNKTYIPLSDLTTWNGVGALTEKIEPIKLIDAEDTDESSAISINNWYFRGKNAFGPYRWITNDTNIMFTNNEFCYFWNLFVSESNYLTNSIPTFDVAIEHNGVYYGCLFGTPKEDYTNDKLPTSAKNKYIYDLFWKNYIGEIYGHNKKVTAYFNITPEQYQQFKFNTLIRLDNQLFLVNKISDFDINAQTSTKCELIQINNPKNLYNIYTFEGGSNPSMPDDPDQPTDTPTEPEPTYYSVTSNTQYCELRYNESVKEGDKFVCTVIPSDGYIIDVDKTYVTMGGIQLDKSVINANSNTITINQVTGDINMSVICKKGVVYYTASGNGHGCTLSYPKSIEAGSTFICNITPVFVDSTYDLNNSTIYMNNFYLIPSDYIDTLMNTITIPNVNGDIRLEIYCISDGGEVNPIPRPDDPTDPNPDPDTPIIPDTPTGEYTVNVTVKGGGVSSYPTSVNYGDSLTLFVTPSEGRRIDTTSSFITMGGTPLSITDYLIGNRIFITNITGDVNISIICGFDIIDDPEKV